MRWLVLIALLVMLCGCGDHDTEAFNEAQNQNTEQAYRAYIAEFPEGKHVTEAEDLVHECAVGEAINKYNRLKSEAIEAENIEDWPKALKLWKRADDALSFDKDTATTPGYEACEKEVKEKLESCRIIIEEPITISGESVSGRYRYTDNNPDTAGTHWSSISFRAKATNNCPFPMSDIVIKLNLISPTALTVNTKTGSDVSRGGSTTLAIIERNICKGVTLAPGQSKNISIKAPVSFNVGLFETSGDEMSFTASPDFPEYNVEIVSFKKR